MSEQSTPPSSAEASAESFTVKNEGGDSNTNQPPNSVKADPEAVPSTTTSSSKRERSPDGEGGQDKSESASAAKKMKQEDGQAASATSAMDDGLVRATAPISARGSYKMANCACWQPRRIFHRLSATQRRSSGHSNSCRRCCRLDCLVRRRLGPR